MKKKSQEKKRKSGISHLKTLKATSLYGSVSNCKYNSAEVRQKTMEDSISQVSNASLSLQLNKSRKENVELESFIKKLEETIKQQNLDMEILSNLTAHMESPRLNNQMEIPPNLAACKESSLFNNLMEIPLNLAALKTSSSFINYMEIPSNLDDAFKVSFNDHVNFIYMELIVSRYKTYTTMLREVRKLQKKLEIIENSQHWEKNSDIKQYCEKKFDDQEKEISSLKFGSVPKTCNAEMNLENAAIEDESKKFPEESIASLSLQLKESREEKVRLDSIIQNLKDTIVEQKLYMEKPEVKSLLSIKLEKEFCRKNIKSWYTKNKDLFEEMEKLKKKVCEIKD